MPELEGAEPIAAYAGLRPAGRGVNYLIGPSRDCPGLVNVAAIRSTGLTASLGIAEHVTGHRRRARDRAGARGSRWSRPPHRRRKARGGGGSPSIEASS